MICVKGNFRDIFPTSHNTYYVPSRGNWGRGVVHGGDPLYQKAVVQLVGESPIRVNAREPGSYSRMFLGNRRCLRENIRPFEWRCETLNFTLIRKLLFV
ncbi:hypothetical protein B0191_21305 [Leptospira interrogans serovar Hardjo]|nr:hypothetical protein B0191_21305 [Leptospira interrogans serovar Hardjo]